MILVTLGTQDKSFVRLLKTLDQEIEKGNLQDEIIVQAGYTKYKSKNMKVFDLVPMDELQKLVKRADIVITHGGIGSILMALKENKKVIAVPRLAQYKEHTNDHQLQIVEDFSVRGYLIAADASDLASALEKVKNFTPKKYKENNRAFVRLIENYLEEDQHISWYNRYRIFFWLFFLILLIGIIFLVGRS